MFLFIIYKGSLLGRGESRGSKTWIGRGKSFKENFGHGVELICFIWDSSSAESLGGVYEKEEMGAVRDKNSAQSGEMERKYSESSSREDPDQGAKSRILRTSEGRCPKKS